MVKFGQVSYLKIRPKVAAVVRAEVVVGEPVHHAVFAPYNVLWVILNKSLHCIPKRRNRLHVFCQRERPA